MIEIKLLTEDGTHVCTILRDEGNNDTQLRTVASLTAPEGCIVANTSVVAGGGHGLWRAGLDDIGIRAHAAVQQANKHNPLPPSRLAHMERSVEASRREYLAAAGGHGRPDGYACYNDELLAEACVEIRRLWLAQPTPEE